MSIFLVGLSAVVGYLLGSISSSIIVGKTYGIDIRQHGSGNAGTTNILRTLGKKAALFVLLGDIIKGVVAYLIGYAIYGSMGAMAGGTAAIIGHNWPLYFRFKGGKGALTSITVVMLMDPIIGLIIIGVFALVVAITRYVSLASIIGALIFPVLSLVFARGKGYIAFSVLIGLLVIFRHRSNLYRILKGNESKLGAKKQPIPDSKVESD